MQITRADQCAKVMYYPVYRRRSVTTAELLVAQFRPGFRMHAWPKQLDNADIIQYLI